MLSRLCAERAGASVFLGLAAAGAVAQSAESTGASRSVYVIPTLSATLTATDNVNLSATDKQSALILGVTPGIQIGGQSGRVKGFFNYALTASVSNNDSEASSFYNNLAARVSAEAVPDRLFIDADASVSQQYIDPFGTQSPNNSLNNDNRTEVSSVNVAPYIKGQIAGQVDYLGRAFYGYTSSGTSAASDSAFWGGLLQFDSTTRWSRLSWGLDLSYREVTFNPGISNFDQLNILSLNYAITPELQVSLRGNVETSNLVTIERETTTGIGGGLRWNPSPRTRLFLEYDRRAFGSSHLYSFDYRTPRTVWSVSSSRSLSTGQRNTNGSPGTVFDLLFAQFASIEPDAAKRTQLVNSFLQANSIDPKLTLSTGFLPEQVQLTNQNQASVAWLGLRNTLAFNVYQTQTENVGPLSNPGNNFAGGNEITWLGFGLTWSHRLTPQSVLSVNGSQQRTSQASGGQETTLWTGTALWSNQLAERVALMLSATYSAQTGTSTYNEASLMAGLSMQF
jgi:uncharacterized protein (PEP-CTERM system associated)